jgi:hypothetical protein
MSCHQLIAPVIAKTSALATSDAITTPFLFTATFNLTCIIMFNRNLPRRAN